MSTCTQPTPTTPQGVDVELADIPAAAWNVTGITGMLVGLFWMLATGRLYTGATHREIVADKDKRIALQDKTIESLTGSVQKQTVNSDLTVSLLRSIDKTANKKRGE